MMATRVWRGPLAAGLWLLLGLCLVGTLHGADAPTRAAAAGRFKQDRFVISFWVDPPADGKMEKRYREIADANFNVVIGGFGATTATQIRRPLDVCRRLGLKALVGVPKRKLENLAPDHPALWGYLWFDEPSAKDFPKLARDVERVRELRPGKLLFMNLFPGYAPAAALGAPTYREHVARFVDTVHPDVLSMDHYPRFDPSGPDGRNGYCDDLEVMRLESLRAGIPFWNFFNTMPYGPQTDPTEAQLRWQIYASVAHGAKGVMYFCYYTPGGDEFPKGGAIIARNDKRTRHYDQAKRLNAELKNLGPTLMKLTSERVARVKSDGPTSPTLPDGTIRSLAGDPKPDYLVGEFHHADGRRAVVLQNYHFAYTAWPTVEFDASADQVMEVSKADGRERPVADDSPDMPGLQLSLDAGEGRLFLLPPRGAANPGGDPPQGPKDRTKHGRTTRSQ